MKPAYLQRDSVHQYIRQIMALPFLPSAHIEQASEELAGRANSDQLVGLVTYVEKQWMNHAIFDIQSWSVFGLTVRTNNDCEGWHNKLNLKAGNQTLTLYRLIPALRSEAERVSYELHLLRDGVSTRRVRQRYANIETKIRELWDMYKADQISTSKLLQDCANPTLALRLAKPQGKRPQPLEQGRTKTVNRNPATAKKSHLDNFVSQCVFGLLKGDKTSARSRGIDAAVCVWRGFSNIAVIKVGGRALETVSEDVSLE
ncbi:uncharacterized protein LOC128549186 [Mercenaria mercenaria]|uniref:uncharacterized protein LOC128549186 n=1 Tax=Mercenaria mercenaria TaxID=6596 RepID=UPI00234E8BC5|nr:uncharacterized protein LOC128549186 [Mercenaria mercenaria]